MGVWLYALGSVLLVSLVSFVGVFTLVLQEKQLKTFLLYFVSFAAGALFGDAFLHLLPDAIEESGGFPFSLSLLVLSGIVLSFIVEKVVHWQHCHHLEHNHQTEKKMRVHTFAIMNLLGDGVHNFLDGLIIGASYLLSIPVGIATTLAVVFHEIPQEIGDFAVLLHGGFKKGEALFYNFLSAVAAFIGVILALVLSQYVSTLPLYLVPIAAGGFIYIAGSDLIPELHKEVKSWGSLLELGMFILGIAVMALLLLLE